MKEQKPTRRTFVKNTGVALGGAWVATHMGAVLATVEQARAQVGEGAAWVHITTEEAQGLAAVADQIFPPGETPGAAEIGAVHFMDAAFGGFMAGALPKVQAGLVDLNEKAGKLGAASFAKLEFDQQTAVLMEVEESGFFGQVHFLTLVGCFSMPAHGGNRDGAGWDMIGFEARHAWRPPFGFYDAQAGAGGGDAGS